MVLRFEGMTRRRRRGSLPRGRWTKDCRSSRRLGSDGCRVCHVLFCYCNLHRKLAASGRQRDEGCSFVDFFYAATFFLTLSCARVPLFFLSRLCQHLHPIILLSASCRVGPLHSACLRTRPLPSVGLLRPPRPRTCVGPRSTRRSTLHLSTSCSPSRSVSVNRCGFPSRLPRFPQRVLIQS